MPAAKKAALDPFNGKGSISFKKTDKTYGDTYTDRYDKVASTAKKLAARGYKMGKTSKNEWTASPGKKPKGGK